MAQSQPGGSRLIKKYPNRRLYDTEQSRYITLEELAGLVRGGARVRVVDAKEGRDLTRQVLTQVILEQQDRLDVLPVELLHLIIQVQGTMDAAPLQGFLKQAFEAWDGLSRTVRGRASGGTGRAAGGTGRAAAGAGRMAEAWMESMRSMASGSPDWADYARRFQGPLVAREPDGPAYNAGGRDAAAEKEEAKGGERAESDEGATTPIDDIKARMDALLGRLRGE